MLQPVELQEVSLRFSGEIAGLRKFFSQAAVRVGDAHAAREIAVRVTGDRAFHRDLMSHIWVLLDESGPSLRYADLLGILMIAAAGVQDAAETNEDDAHTLLRFLMEARHTLDGTPARTEPALTRPATPALSEVRATSGLDVQLNPTFSERRRMPSRSAESPTQRLTIPREDKQDDRQQRPAKRRGLVYAAAAVCVIAALLFGYVALRERDTPAGEVAVKSSVSPNGTGVNRTPAAREDVFTGKASNGSPPAGLQRSQAVAPFRAAERPERSTPSAYGEHAERSAVVPIPATVDVARSIPVIPPALPSAVSSLGTSRNAVAATAATNNGPASIVLKSQRSGSAVPAAVAADTLTARLDSPRLPAYAADPEESRRGKYPRLLRRHTGGALNESADPTLSAELRAPDLSGASSSSRNAFSVARGVVRSTCLGMMAGNLVYGPTPSYPASAVSAHVQGEVKIQATVDRDGTVNAARVISGPPLLRDAALDAVQHWRYKPFLTGGKPAATGTTAIVNFELQ